jgi:phosphate:Na+ symporter
MMNLAMLGSFAGGIGLFLLGMSLMTDGLKLAAGPSLERILAQSTKTPMRGLLSGAMVTAVVQSSSAVTVATIGFVNAGLFQLSQAVWVLFGANVGTTMTGWLVALVGLKFKIETLALPMIGIGMLLRMTDEHSRRGAGGQALAGFGVLFLGIDMLRMAFTGLADGVQFPNGDNALDTLLLVLSGAGLTVLMQSSSAALTIALTAAQGGLLTTQAAAAVVIGANVGTTVTAVIAALGATPNARRAAAAHIIFNLLTGCVALLLLPWLIRLLQWLGAALGVGTAPAATLALFHTAFNVLGVVLIWPVADRMTSFLTTCFRRPEEDAARARYLDRTVLAVPALALDALEREVRHMAGIALRAARAVVGSPPLAVAQARAECAIARRLNRAIASFITDVNRSGMSAESASRLAGLLRTARYFEATAELAVEAAQAAAEHPTQDAWSSTDYSAFHSATDTLLASIEAVTAGESTESPNGATALTETAYQALKARWLADGAEGRMPTDAMDAGLRAASALRRALQQATKGARMLASAPPSNEAV